ncbi:MAG TPA: pyocin knob domain-containing S74 family peptidase [Buttiauxella sp.]|jgi:hypothetical protein
MADIFTGNGLSLSYNTDTGNRSPQGIGNVQINEVAEFPALEIESEVNQYDTYNSTYNSKLLAEKSANPLDIVVNYLPDDSTHQFLDEAAENQDVFQLTIAYQEEGSQLTYAMVNGAITSTQLSGDKDSVVTKTYEFTPTDVVARSQAITALLPIYQGDYGVGSNTTDVPQYAPTIPTGNSFIKVPSTQAGNPAGADMMGVGLVDGSAVSSFAMTKSGTLSIYAKNATTAWTRIYTATQMDTRYVPLTRTVNGKQLSTDIVLTPGDVGAVPVGRTVNGHALSDDVVLSKDDVGLGSVTDDAQLAISHNLSDLTDTEEARTNLDVYSKGEVDTFGENYVQKITTVNGKPLSTDITLAKGDVGLSSVTNDAQLKITSNLSDLANIAISRSNLGLGSLAVQNANAVAITGGTAALSSLSLSTALPITSGGTGATTVAAARTALGLGTAATTNIGTSGSTVPLLSTFNTWNGVQTFTTTIQGNVSGTASNVTGIVPISNGGTGASTADNALLNLSAMKFQRTSLGADDNLNDIDGSRAGFYYCTSNSNSTEANNYPVIQAGSLMVLRNGANGDFGCTQIYSPYNSNDIYIRTGFAGTTNSWSGWNVILQKGSFGIGADLTVNASTPIANLNESTPTGFYYTANENTLGGITSDTTYSILNRGGRPTAVASKYVQQRSWDGWYTGTNGWVWKENAYMSALNQGQFKVQANGEAIRIVSTSGQACYIMGMLNDTYDVAQRRWYFGNGGSDNTVVAYNSRTNNSMGLAAAGNVYIQARSDSTGSGTAYTTQFQSNGTIVGPQGTVTQTASDIRLKSDVNPANKGALERINAIGCVEFTWDSEQRRDRGFIAQQIANIDPLYTYKPTEDGYLNYSITALMSDTFGAIQELVVINSSQANAITSLEATIESQQSQIDELKVLSQSLLDNK